VRSRNRGAVLLISSKLEWAKKACVAGTASYTIEKGWWGLPHIDWKADINDQRRFEELAGILVKVMRSRHL